MDFLAVLGSGFAVGAWLWWSSCCPLLTPHVLGLEYLHAPHPASLVQHHLFHIHDLGGGERERERDGESVISGSKNSLIDYMYMPGGAPFSPLCDNLLRACFF